MKSIYGEVAVAACVGAMAGLAISLSFGWGLEYAWLLGGLIGALCVRPHEVYAALKNTMIQEPIYSQQTLNRAKKYGLKCVKFVFYFAITACSICFIPTLVALICTLNGIRPFMGQAVFLCTAIICVLFSMVAPPFRDHARAYLGYDMEIPEVRAMTKEKRFPIIRHAARFFVFIPSDEKIDDLIKSGPIRSHLKVIAIIGPIFQCIGVLAIVLWIVDALLSLFIVLMNGQRFAAFNGAAAGCIIATIVSKSLGGSMAPVAVIAIGGIAGFCCGPIFYKIATILAAPTRMQIALREMHE